MADIHVLTTDKKGQVSVVLHIPIPEANNVVGVGWRTALVNSGIGGTSSMAEGTGPGEITTAELALIATGALFEHRATFPLDSSAPGQYAADLQALFATQEIAAIAALQVKLKYFGHTGDEA